MWSFFADLFRNVDATHTVVVMNSDEVGTGRRYRLDPRNIVAVWGGSLLAVGIVVGLLFLFTPLRTVVPGYGTEEMKNQAQLNSMRVKALQDSVNAQRRYIDRLRQLITGGVDTSGRSAPKRSNVTSADVRPTPSGHEQMPLKDETGIGEKAQESPFSSTVLGSFPAPNTDAGAGPTFPVEPPVLNGFPTRGFDAKTGHYGVDIAVSEGTYVRAVGSGYVVVADWTRDGGYTVVIQHSGGYLSVYKHNKRLLKQIGDRVNAREPVAVSGNTGEVTTGPHLHFELWRNGLVQNPHSYVTGW